MKKKYECIVIKVIFITHDVKYYSYSILKWICVKNIQFGIFTDYSKIINQKRIRM